LFVIAATRSSRWTNIRCFAAAGCEGTVRAAALVFCAYTCYARIATLGEEVREAQRTIPRAIEITIGGVLVLYLAVALVAAGAVGTDALAPTAPPREAAAPSFGAGWGRTGVADRRRGDVR